MPAQNSRQEDSTKVRYAAADLARDRTSKPDDERHSAVLEDGKTHQNNGEEETYAEHDSYMSFSKGLEHNVETGMPKPGVVGRLRDAINGGHVKGFDDIDIGCPDTEGKLKWTFYKDLLGDKAKAQQYRRWEAPTAGFVYDLQGPDSLAVTMQPAPAVEGETSDELIAEMAEVYLLALLRDVPFAAFSGDEAADDKVSDAIGMLSDLPFYDKQSGERETNDRIRPDDLTRQNVFRGQTEGEHEGPYLSQFLLVGNPHLGAPATKPHSLTDGQTQYGSIRIDHRVRVARPYVDYMTHWDEWLDVQHGANVRDEQDYVADGDKDYPTFRFISTPRDLATYVHFDALYEAYLNACIWLLNEGVDRDPNFADKLANTKSTEGFALFGGPHVLTLVTEVATRALKAVRYQKFNNHLRARPEVLAARVAAYDAGVAKQHPSLSVFGTMHSQLEGIGLLDAVRQHNIEQNKRGQNASYLQQVKGGIAQQDNLPLLPMAFPEGSPMHPSYGAGHATVAGACVTMLKAFFDESAVLPFAYEPSIDGSKLNSVALKRPLTVGGELNKLAANISIGRNMAGVHFYSDYIDSMRMGEAIAIGVLQEQALTYPKDPFTVSFQTFDGKNCTVTNEQDKTKYRVTVQFA